MIQTGVGGVGIYVRVHSSRFCYNVGLWADFRWKLGLYTDHAEIWNTEHQIVFLQVPLWW